MGWHRQLLAFAGLPCAVGAQSAIRSCLIFVATMFTRILLANCVVGLILADPVLDRFWSKDQQAQLLANTKIYHMHEVSSVSEPIPAPAGETYRPTVVAHGMGDSGTNPGMKSLCKTVSDKYPGAFVLCSTTADSGKSISMTFDKQLADFQAEIASHPELKNGFNAVGLSQGNFLLEAYIALVNDPPVYNFVSICGPLQGEATCPSNIAFDLICPVWKLDPYGAPLAFSSYWKGTKDKDTYLAKSRMLADVLNEKDTKNATVANNFKALNSMMMIEATEDTMIEPKESEQYGMWDWGTSGKKAPIVALRDSEGYKGDFIGLQTLDKAGKLHSSQFVGEHIRFNNSYWDSVVLPYFNNYLPTM